MKCPKCNFDNPPAARFCEDCGAELLSIDKTLGYPTTTRLPPIEEFAAGTCFAGKYEVIEELGRGGMGIVYRARDKDLRRMAALKFLSPSLLRDPAHRKRFIQEAQTASALNHPHICTVYEVGEADGKAYIAMEYIEGRALSMMMKPAGLSVEDAVRYGLQIAEALHHAHSRNIIHRDLKPANIIITPEGRVKVLDFGLAKHIQEEELGGTSLSRVVLSEPGSIAGTLQYMAPELLSGGPASIQSDIWALGTMLYEMVTGKPPFEGKTGFEIATSIIRDSPAPLPDRIPCGLRDIILRSLEKELVKRCNSATDIRDALEGFAAPKIASPSISARSRWPNWRRRLFMGGAVLVAMFLVFILGSKRVGQRELVRNHSRVSTGAQASPNLQANEYFERAMLFLIPQFDLPRARNQLERSLKLDPNFAEARAWYGFSFVLEIDSGLSNDMSLLYRAEEELRLASRSAPRTAKIHSSLAALYLYQGRKELIPEEAKKALEIDPYELDANIWLANYYISNGDNSSAETLQNKLLAQNPLFFPARMNLADILRQKGRIADAIAELEKILEQSPQNIYAAQKLARTYIDTNDLRRARQILESLPFETQKGYEIKLTWVLLLALEGKKKEASQRLDDDVLKYSRIAFWSTSVAAECYALLGDSPKALEWLELAARNGDERDSWFRRDPLLANIRGLARFNQIVESIANRRLQRARAGVQK